MGHLIAILMSGLTQGSVYALIALGIVLLQNATGVINFAQGDLMTLGAYVGFFLLVQHHSGQLPMYLIVPVVLFGVGVIIERVGYAPLRNRNPLTIVISTFALGLAIRSGLLVWQGSEPRNLPSPVDYTVNVLGAQSSVSRCSCSSCGRPSAGRYALWPPIAKRRSSKASASSASRR